MTIAQLESILNSRRARLTQLVRDRNRAQQKLTVIERQISSLSGRANGMAGGRSRNVLSLSKSMEKVLRGAGKPVSVGDIVASVVRGGYKSNSANFRSIVNQTLIKDKQFASAGRGMYQLKK